jgi:hypothetical protein
LYTRVGTGDPLSFSDWVSNVSVGTRAQATNLAAAFAVYTLPEVAGDVGQHLRSNGAGAAEWFGGGGAITATTSGTAFDFTGIPEAVQEVEILLDLVSLSSIDNLLVQLGTSGGIVAFGYDSASAAHFSSSNSTNYSTSGFLVKVSNLSRSSVCVVRIHRIEPGSNVWIADHSGFYKEGVTGYAISGGGRVSLAGELTQVRITRDGTNTFDAGQLNVRWK